MIKKFFMTLLLVFFLLPAAHAQSYTMAIGPAPGFIQDDKAPGDILYKTVLKHLSEQGINVSTQFMPWKRADKMFNENRVDIEFPALLGDKSLKNAIFSAPVSKVGMVIFTQTNQPKIDSLDQLKGKIGIVRGFTYPDELNRNRNIDLQEGNSIEDVLKMLSYGRLDAIIHWGAASMAALDNLNLNNIHSGDEFTLSFGCFAARLSSEGANVITAINQVLGEMIVKGEYQKIMSGSYRSLIGPTSY